MDGSLKDMKYEGFVTKIEKADDGENYWSGREREREKESQGSSKKTFTSSRIANLFSYSTLPSTPPFNPSLIEPLISQSSRD